MEGSQLGRHLFRAALVDDGREEREEEMQAGVKGHVERHVGLEEPVECGHSRVASR